MDNTKILMRAKLVLMIMVASGLVSLAASNGFAQNSLPVISAAEVVGQFETSQPVAYENVTILGDVDLSKLSARTNDAVYPENGRTARVFSAQIVQPITFKNVTFNGKLIFFRKSEIAQEIKEYRLVFSKTVVLENCTFTGTADFELTNFDGGVSFARSTFKAKPSFIRIGLETAPDLTQTVFADGSIFKNFQNDAPLNLTAAELENVYRKYIASRQ